MADVIQKIKRIIDSRTDLTANLGNNQIAIETDHDEHLVWNDDDGTYHIAAEIVEDMTNGSIPYASGGAFAQNNLIKIM